MSSKTISKAAMRPTSAVVDIVLTVAWVDVVIIIDRPLRMGTVPLDVVLSVGTLPHHLVICIELLPSYIAVVCHSTFSWSFTISRYLYLGVTYLHIRPSSRLR